MLKKMISIFVLFTFIFYLITCTSTRYLTKEELSQEGEISVLVTLNEDIDPLDDERLDQDLFAEKSAEIVSQRGRSEASRVGPFGPKFDRADVDFTVPKIELDRRDPSARDPQPLELGRDQKTGQGRRKSEDEKKHRHDETGADPACPAHEFRFPVPGDRVFGRSHVDPIVPTLGLSHKPACPYPTDRAILSPIDIQLKVTRPIQ